MELRRHSVGLQWKVNEWKRTYGWYVFLMVDETEAPVTNMEIQMEPWQVPVCCEVSTMSQTSMSVIRKCCIHGQPIHHRDLCSPSALWITNKHLELHHLLVLIMSVHSLVCLKLGYCCKRKSWPERVVNHTISNHTPLFCDLDFFF